MSSTSGSNSCWDKTLQVGSDIPILPFLPPFQVLFLSLYFVFGFSLNGFVVFLVLRYRERLFRREFALVLQVVAADLISVCCYPVVIATRSSGLWLSLGPSWCSMLGFVHILFLTLRYTTMFLLSFDRFNMVFFPFTYPLHGNKIMLPLTVSVWLVSLLFATIPLSFQCFGLQKATGFCGVSIFCSSTCATWRYVQDSVAYVVGAFVPVVLYSLMFWKARQLSRRVADSGSQALADESHKRARYTFLFLFVTLMGCGIPQFGNVLLMPLKTHYADVYWTYVGLSAIALFTVVILDPLVIIKHQDVRNCALKLLQSVVPQRAPTRAKVVAVLISSNVS